MKKTILVLLMTLSASAAFSKQLTVVCEKQAAPNIANVAGATLSAVMEIANVNSAPVFQEFQVQGQAGQVKVVGQTITKDAVDLSLQFGQRLYSSARIVLADCGDSFAATGSAQVDVYVGGFAGNSRQNLKCTCELK
jgi:hypothetical protein